MIKHLSAYVAHGYCIVGLPTIDRIEYGTQLLAHFRVLLYNFIRNKCNIKEEAKRQKRHFGAHWTIAIPRTVFFYRAMLCIRGTSHGPVSVCLSVTSRCSTKTAERRITQTTPHDSPGTVFFGSQRSPRNSTGVTPYGGTKCSWGGSKSATFDQ